MTSIAACYQSDKISLVVDADAHLCISTLCCPLQARFRIGARLKAAGHVAPALSEPVRQLQALLRFAVNFPRPLAGKGEVDASHEGQHVFQRVTKKYADLMGKRSHGHAGL